MSQSDYLQRKKLETELKPANQKKFTNTIETNNYILYKKYNIENTVISKNKLYNQLLQNGRIHVFDMELNPTNCSTYVSCINTDTRPYRKIINPASMNPYASIGHLPFITGPNQTTLYQLKYQKKPYIRKCPPCLYDSSYNRHHTNNENTDFTKCSNNRLNQTLCEEIQETKNS